MIVRFAVQKDYEGIAELIINELGYKNQKHEDIYTRLSIIERNNSYQTLVACIDDAVVGFIGLRRTVTYESDEYITILAFAVSEKYQRQGIGKALLSASMDYAEKHYIKRIKVSCALHRMNSHLFYESNNFERVAYTFIKDL